jgi:hypothetical protein
MTSLALLALLVAPARASVTARLSSASGAAERAAVAASPEGARGLALAAFEGGAARNTAVEGGTFSAPAALSKPARGGRRAPDAYDGPSSDEVLTGAVLAPIAGSALGMMLGGSFAAIGLGALIGGGVGLILAVIGLCLWRRGR